MDRARSIQHRVMEGARAEALTEVPDAAPGLPPFPGSPGLRPSDAFEDLSHYRMEYPFVPIMPLPTFVLTKVLTMNVAANIDVPSGMALGMIKANGPFWVSWKETATIPVAPSSTWDYASSNAAYNMIDTLFYIAHVKQLSFISDAAVTVQLLGWPLITASNPGVRNV